MAKEKATVTLDRSKADEARSLVGARSTSDVIERALDLLIRVERLRRDITAYRRVPPTDAEIEIAVLADTAGVADDTDWEALYAETRGDRSRTPPGGGVAGIVGQSATRRRAHP